MLLPVVAIPDPAANFLHVGAQIFFIAPLRNLGKNALQLLVRLLIGWGEFFAKVLLLDSSLRVQRQLTLFCPLDCILNIG